MEYYVIVNPDRYETMEPFIPLSWSKIPDEIFEEVPEYYLKNIKSVNENGIIESKTIVYLEKIDKEDFEESCDGFIAMCKIGENKMLGVDDDF